jgi:signal transduction histidine kinase
VEVQDTGSGMTKQQARNAFKPGYSTKKRGWGLGLSLAKE